MDNVPFICRTNNCMLCCSEKTGLNSVTMAMVNAVLQWKWSVMFKHLGMICGIVIINK